MQPGLDPQVCWYPSIYERKHHPELPADACVRGRVIVQQATASDGSRVTLYPIYHVAADGRATAAVVRSALESRNGSAFHEADDRSTNPALPKRGHDRQTISTRPGRLQPCPGGDECGGRTTPTQSTPTQFFTLPRCSSSRSTRLGGSPHTDRIPSAPPPHAQTRCVL